MCKCILVGGSPSLLCLDSAAKGQAAESGSTCTSTSMASFFLLRRLASPLGQQPPEQETSWSRACREPLQESPFWQRMRERVTFAHAPDTDVDPGALDVQPAGLVGPPVRAVRQDRLTFGVNELPLELATLLRGYRAVHLRWTSPRHYDTLEPFASRQPPGLHFYYIPLAPGPHDSSKLCQYLQRLGSLDCMDPEAFTAADTPQSGPPGSKFFYQGLEHLTALVTSGLGDLCPKLDAVCLSRLRSLYTAVSLDISFDSADQALVIAALWPLREHPLTVPGSSTRRTEVGIFTKGSPPNLGPHEVGLGGVLHVLGEQRAPSPVLFAAPSRHRLSGASFSSQFLSPTGLHPTLQLKLSTNKPPVQDSDCAPYAYLGLPKPVFADRYQFQDKLWLASKNLTASRYTTLPVDLEAPEYTTKTWGSNVLVELAAPDPGKEQAWTAQMPLHLRYLKPTASGYAQVEIPYPAVFWACKPGGDADLSTNPFDRRHLGYDELFDSGTTFWHADPKPEVGDRLMNSISVPVLREDGEAWVRLGTTAAVGLGCAWVTWKLLAAWMGSTRQGGRAEGKTGRRRQNAG